MAAMTRPRLHDSGSDPDPHEPRAHPPTHPPTHPPAHLPTHLAGVYRRRRLLAAALAAVLMAVLAYGAWSLAIDVGDRLFTGQAGAAAVVGEPEAEVWVVQPGDTLWSIAVELGGDVDVRQRVDQLAEHNGGPMIEVGQRLLIPPR